MWCGPCKPEIPYRKKLFEKYSRDDFEIIGISLDRDVEKLKKFITDNNMNWIHICEENKWDGSLVNKFNGFKSIPKTYVLDRNGVIRFKDLRKDKMVSAVESLINKNVN